MAHKLLKPSLFLAIISLVSCSSKNFSPELEEFISHFNFEHCYIDYVKCVYETNAKMMNRQTGETIDTCYTYREYDKSDENNLYYKYQTTSTGTLLNDLDKYGYSLIEIVKIDDGYKKTITNNDETEELTISKDDALTIINEMIRKAEGTYNLKASGLYYGDMIDSLYNYQELLSLNEDKSVITYDLKNALVEDVNIFNLKIDVNSDGMILNRNLSSYNINSVEKYISSTEFTYQVK